MNAKKVALLLFAALIALRLAYFDHYSRLPFLDGPLFDAQVYLAQAQAISAGHYGDPTLLAFSPLYGYFLYAFGGLHNPVGIVLLQHAMALATLSLVFCGLKRRHGPMAGLFGTFLLGGYGFLTFFETKLQSETLGMFLLASALHAYNSPALQRGSASASLVAGCLFGLATLARASLIFCLPFVAVAPYFSRFSDRCTRGRRILRAAWAAVGIALVLGANGLWNLHHTGVFVPVILVSKTAATSSQTEWSGNLNVIKAGHGPPSSWDVVEQARKRLAQNTATGLQHAPRESSPLFGVDVLGWARRVPSRLLLTFRDVETSHEYRYYGERKHLYALNLHPVSFGLLCLCAALGVLALWKSSHLRVLHGLWPVLVGTLVTTTLVMPSARYRLPMVLPLAMMGAVGLGWLWDQRDKRARLAWIAIVALFVIFAVRTQTHEPRHPGLWELTLAEAALAAGNHEQGEHYLQKAMSRHGDDPVIMQRTRLLLGR